mmetsp:Transcript_17542/g.30100  ORF Transcript_17542/g.30100 Transcript_17542/m.30100 type:complete len:311 (+) Transcript_17542:63-995(+)|eukprot:CAMPEP_0119101062 /NCGR_PEP_ID=MMETSP1180-20130426/196_1 /TAXON_ID=3052 ORGANISM="Chlamydomonas cf sp, Strain CCMP681" /NCGR_SAMPLE_ID=MMETSP1180 /ASSEMBLY_ACC=CAM_ASM_000741 /LENGTH=310 /DNA_ID=CAMNT_0007085103 /DNA_START=63 /DNA_END=995 /DNA_ORIENTATION=+
MAPAAPLVLMGARKDWRRRGQPELDALPYLDNISPEVKALVDAMIQEEGPRGIKRPAAYEADLPSMTGPRFDGHPVLQHEYDRTKAKESMQPLATDRYRLDRPSQSRTNDVNAWKSSVENAHSQLEHQYNRIQNLELLLKYGDKSWRAQTMLDEATLKHMESELQATRKVVTELNQERKLSQTSAGAELRRTEQEYYQLVQKNLQIESACEDVEQEVHVLKAQLASKSSAHIGSNGSTTTTHEALANNATAMEVSVDEKVQVADTVQEADAASVEGVLVPGVIANEVETANGAEAANEAEAAGQIPNGSA